VCIMHLGGRGYPEDSLMYLFTHDISKHKFRSLSSGTPKPPYSLFMQIKCQLAK
jgi:hypothetical protein